MMILVSLKPAESLFQYDRQPFHQSQKETRSTIKKSKDQWTPIKQRQQAATKNGRRNAHNYGQEIQIDDKYYSYCIKLL